MRLKQLLDELHHRPATGAMVHLDGAFAPVQRSRELGLVELVHSAASISASSSANSSWETSQVSSCSGARKRP
jgi:hypothetical protein